MKSRLHIEKALMPDEIDRVTAAADELLNGDRIEQRQGLLAWVALGTGLRVSELRRLEWEHIDLEAGRIQVWRHKKRSRGWIKGQAHSGAMQDSIPIPQTLIQRLKQVKDRGYLFKSNRYWIRSKGRKVEWSDDPANASVRTMQKDWAVVLKRAGVRYRSIHGARHTYATRIADITRNPFAVRDALGHSDGSIMLSALYVDRNPNRQKEIADQIFI